MNNEQKLAMRITNAIAIITEYGSFDGAHHKQWCLDQVVRALLPGKEYESWREQMLGEYDNEARDYIYEEWDEGTPP